MAVIQDLLAAQRERDQRPIPTEGPDIQEPQAPSPASLRAREREVLSTLRPINFTERLREKLQTRFEEKVKPLREERGRAVAELKTQDLFGPAADMKTKRLLGDIDFIDQRIQSNQNRINEFAQTATSGFVEDRKVALSEIQSLIKEQKELETQKQQKESQAFKQMLDEKRLGLEERRVKVQEAQESRLRGRLGGANPFATRHAGRDISSTKIEELEPPSFEDFVKQREEQLQRSLTADAREALKDDYNDLKKSIEIKKLNQEEERIQKLSPLSRQVYQSPENAAQAFTPTQLGDIMEEIASVGLPVRNILDGKKKSLPPTVVQGLSQANLVRSNIQRIQEKMNNIDPNFQGPIVGYIRQNNPWDDTAVEIDQLITATVPGLARGIFQERGVLTDSDIRNYTKTMANPRLTRQQAITATQNLLRIVDEAVQSQIDAFESTGYKVGGIEGVVSPQKDVNISNLNFKFN